MAIKDYWQDIDGLDPGAPLCEANSVAATRRSSKAQSSDSAATESQCEASQPEAHLLLSWSEISQFSPSLRRRILEKRWIKLSRDQREKARYQRDALILAEIRGEWQPIGFRQLSEHSNTLVLLPFEPDSRPQEAHSGTPGPAPVLKQFHPALLASNTEALSSASLVLIQTPTEGEQIWLTESVRTRRRFTSHQLRQGQTAESVVNSSDRLLSVGELFGFNPQFSHANPPQPGDDLRIPDGWDIEVSGTAINAASVTLRWQGPVTGEKQLTFYQNR